MYTLWLMIIILSGILALVIVARFGGLLLGVINKLFNTIERWLRL